MKTEVAGLLLKKAFDKEETAGLWADLGCGSGFFTNALALQLFPKSEIYAIDKQANLQLISNNKGVITHFQAADFEKDNLDLPALNGILMANSLHFVEDKKKLIKKLSHHLAENGKFVIIEYDTDRANTWVPYPISFAKLQALFSDSGFMSVEKMAETKSLYGSGMIYSCLIKSK